MEVVLVDPDTAGPELLDSLHRCRVATHAVDLPDDPPLPYAQTLAYLQPDGLGERKTWAAVDGGEVVGRVRLALADKGSNAHACDVAIEVRPDVRRRGIGRLLLDRAIDEARRDDRTVMTGEEEWESGAAFARHVGAELAMENTRSVLDVASAHVEASVAPGYTLVRWTDSAPERYIASFAAVKEDMADAPIGTLDINPWRWDAQRIRALEDTLRRQQRKLHVVVAVHEATDEVAGLTELLLWPDPDQRGDQHDTIVARAHRGHGLGMAIKAEMVQWMRADYPTLREIETWNASDNTHMLAVNTAMGFKPIAVEREWQLRI
jgi:mycothiol synthase